MELNADERALMEEFRVFGYYDPACKFEEVGHGFGLEPCPERSTCREWVLTDIINRSLKGMDDALTWCDETKERLFTLQDALDYVIENMEWEKVSHILKANHLDDDWLSDRIDRFERWVEAFYLDDEVLSEIYQAVETNLQDELSWEKTKDWLMHNHN